MLFEAMPLGDSLPLLTGSVLTSGIDSIGVVTVTGGTDLVGVDSVRTGALKLVSTSLVRNPPGDGSTFWLAALLFTDVIGEKILSTLFCPSSRCAKEEGLDNKLIVNELRAPAEPGDPKAKDESFPPKTHS